MTDEESDDSALPAGARRDSGIFLLLFGISVVLYFMSIPLLFGVIVTGPLAALFAARALYRSRSVPGAVGYRVGLFAGILASGFALLTGLAMIFFHAPVSELQNCNARAITQTAEDECQRDYRDGINDVVETWLDRVDVSF